MASLKLKDIAAQQDKWVKMALYIGARWDEADDMVQSMYLKLAEIEAKEGNLNRIKAGEGVNTMYVFKTLQSCVMDVYRLEKKQAYSTDVACTQDSPDDAEYKYQELMGQVKTVIDQMNDYDQMLLELHFVYGHSMRELCRRTGIPTHSIFNTLKNAKTHIKQQVKNKFNEYQEAKQETPQVFKTRGRRGEDNESYGD